MSSCVLLCAFASRRQSCTRHSEDLLNVSQLFGSNGIVRGIAAASLVAALAVGVGSIPTALAEVSPAPADAPAEALLPTVATATVDSTVAALVATATVPAPAVPSVKTKKLTVRQTIDKVGRASGLSKTEIDALMWMCKRESNFHPTSHSRSNCHGLFQLSKGMAHGHPWKDPAWNTKRAIKYMRGRYGGVMKAKAFWLSHHWY
jgi:hypothetical protein